MKYKFVVYATIDCKDDEIIGAKEAINEALELMGCDVQHISVLEAEK